jgi:hypothetical protein
MKVVQREFAARTRELKETANVPLGFMSTMVQFNDWIQKVQMII